MKLDKFYINGEFVSPSTTNFMDVINPFTEEAVASVALGNAEDIDRAVKAARQAFAITSALSKKDRMDILQSLINVFDKRSDDIAEAIRLEMGAPVQIAKSQQTKVGLRHLQTALRVLENHDFEYEYDKFLIREEPIGVCGLITPWNWPINQIMAKTAPAIAAGCSVVLKPSEIAPLSGMVFAEVVHEAGLPAGAFNLVNGTGPEAGEAMSAHPDIDMMSFTGSTRGGIAVASTAAKTVKRVSQELGGKSPNIVLDDGQFSASVADGVNSVMGNSGQSCNAPTRMLVPAHRHDEALEIAKTTAEQIVVGDPQNEATNLGPVVSDVQFEKIQDLIDAGIKEGARLVIGGTGRPEGLNKGYFVRPTVFGEVTNDMTIAREEIFGPVLSVISYNDIDDAVEIANDTVYGLAAYVSGKDTKTMQDISRRLRSGQVHINHGSAGTDAPFGGYKQSGNGREKAEWGLSDFLETKAIMGS